MVVRLWINSWQSLCSIANLTDLGDWGTQESVRAKKLRPYSASPISHSLIHSGVLCRGLLTIVLTGYAVIA